MWPFSHEDNELWNAVLDNDIQEAKRALQQGANVNMWDQETPLFFAIENNNKKLVQLLLNYGANVCITDFMGRTPLFYAVIKESQHLVPLLVQNNPAVMEIATNEGNKPLPFAAYKNSTYIVKTLLNLGANVNSQALSKTALYWAAYHNNREMTDILLEAGADVCLQNNGKNICPLDGIKSDDIRAHIAVYGFIDKGLNTLINGESPVLYSAKLASTPSLKEAVIKEFIQAGALVSLQNADGKTVYEHLSENASPNVMFLLNKAKEREEKTEQNIEKFIQNEKEPSSLLPNGHSPADMRRTIGILTKKLITKHSAIKKLQTALSQNNITRSK